MIADLRLLSIKREADGLLMSWSDGVQTQIDFRQLRKSCPCASCLEAKAKPADPFRILTPEEVAAGDPMPVSMKPRGYYAYQIVWNDGHDTGIYSLELLRQLSSTTPATNPPGSK